MFEDDVIPWCSSESLAAPPGDFYALFLFYYEYILQYHHVCEIIFFKNVYRILGMKINGENVMLDMPEAAQGTHKNWEEYLIKT